MRSSPISERVLVSHKKPEQEQDDKVIQIIGTSLPSESDMITQLKMLDITLMTATLAFDCCCLFLF